MLKQLYEQDYPRLKRLAYSMAGNEWEDIVQDSFIKMIPYQHLSYGEAKALITTIVRNKCYDWLRHQKYVASKMKRLPEQVAAGEMLLPLEAKQLRDQVKKLPDYTRSVIEMHFFEEMHLREIGKIVGRDHSTVHSQIRTGLRKLKPVV